MPTITQSYHQLMAQTDIGSDALIKIGEENEKVVLINADLMHSSRTQHFSNRFPDRSFNVGIAEQEMVSFAAGLASEGFLPYCFTFSTFLTMRACEQIRTDVCYNGLPVRFMGIKTGYSAGLTGATHSALEDVGIMCSMGNMSVVECGDAMHVAKILEASVDFKGPLYIRMGREEKTHLYTNDTKLQIGKAVTVREGNDGTFICSGCLVHFAINAANRIKQDYNINIRVVDMHTIKPIDAQAVMSAVDTGAIICAQDGNIQCGLGYQVANVIAQSGKSCKFKILGCPDHYVPIATTDYLYAKNGYDENGLYESMISMLQCKAL